MKKNTFLTICLSLFLVGGLFAQTTWYVTAGSNGGNNTTGDGSESSPFATPFKAHAAAAAGDIIIIDGEVIQPGTINVTKSLTFTGINNAAIIDNAGALQSRVFNINANNVSLTFNDLGFKNFEKKDSNGSAVTGETGIVLNTNGKTGVTLAFNNCIFDGNKSTKAGALYINNGTVVSLTNCLFKENQAENQGGAIHIIASNVTMTGCTFYKNKTTSTTPNLNAGAMYVNGASSVVNVDYCTFFQNTTGASNQDYGTIRTDNGNTTVTNSLFYDNKTLNDTGAPSDWGSGSNGTQTFNTSIAQWISTNVDNQDEGTGSITGIKGGTGRAANLTSSNLFFDASDGFVKYTAAPSGDDSPIDFGSDGNDVGAWDYVDNPADTTAPVITVIGDDPATVELGAAYTDAGATASDNIDGDITNSIITVNNVNTNIVASYTVTYNVSDASGNAATEVTRTVNVVDTFAPNTYFVKAGGNNNGGLSEENAFEQVNFAVAAASDGDTITIVGAIAQDTQFEIGKSISFVGQSDATITGAGATNRLYNISEAGKTISFTDVIFKDNTGATANGSVFNTIKGGTLAFTNCVFSGNSSVSNGGGGAIYVNNASAVLTITGCTFYNNSSGNATNNGQGGAIMLFNSSASSTITNSTFFDNKITRSDANFGASVRVNNNGKVTISNSLSYNNKADSGAGAGSGFNASPDATLNVLNSIVDFTNNTDTSTGSNLTADLSSSNLFFDASDGFVKYTAAPSGDDSPIDFGSDGEDVGAWDYVSTGVDADGDGFNSDVDCNDNDASVNAIATWYIGVDTDSDGFIGSVTNTQSCSSPGAGYALTAPAITDCNDDDAAVNAIATWYIGVDTDSDGFIGSVTDTQSCDSPGTGYALTAPAITDCNDDDAAVNAIATWYIGVDTDSDGFIGSVTDTQSCDSPGTGYALTAPAITDCNDDDAAVNAIATWYIGVDTDSDGFIGSVTDTQSCDSPGTGYALTAPAITDCNDDDAAVNAIATWYIGVDTDSDGFIGSVTDTQSCDSPGTGYALTAPAITDCNDDDAAVNAIATWYIGVDADSDGFIGSVTDTQSCDSPGTGYALTAPAITDCNDDDAAVNAIATWYIGVDTDSDGFIGSVTDTQSCDSPGTGYALTAPAITDCNDDDAAVNAIATWYIGVDTDSDGFIGSVTDTQSCDSPGTGYALTAPAITDCNDDDAAVNAIATWYIGVDTDSDGFIGSVTDTQSCDSPGTGYALTAPAITDCNDDDAAVNGATTTWYIGVDTDSDGFIGSVTDTQSCDSPGTGYALTAPAITDCNDNDASVNAIATWYIGVDTDSDGFIGSVTDTQSCSSPGTGYALTAPAITDCNDDDAAVNAIATWYIGVDTDSDGFIGSVTDTQSCDSPGTGYALTAPAITDCNDNDAAVNAIATWYIGVDTDSDGFIGSVTDTQSCDSPGTGYALTAPAITDCNDDDAAVNAIATWYIGVDTDSDGFIGSVTDTQSCDSPGTGYALTAPAITDCNDDDAAVNAIATWYIGVDTDSDGFIGSVTDTQSCDSPGTGYALTAPAITDCNDDDAAVNAIATWYIGVDTDSDGFIGSVTDTQSCDSPGTGYALTAPAITDCNDDDAAVNAIATWYIGVDTDSDGFIGSVTDTQSCDSPGTGYALTAPAITDCNDDDAAVNAIATWYIGVDTDSDGFIGSVTDTQSCDSPGTGYALTAPAITDCNDDDAAVNAIATWYIGVDTDSDGFIGSVTDTQSCDSPGTGYALTAPAITDCNDDDAAVNAIATWYIGVDTDSDGFIGSVTDTQSCDSPGTGYALTAPAITDCNDDDAAVNAIATWYIGVDTDSDGFIGSVTDTQSCDSPGTGYALTAPAITDCNDDDAAVNAIATWYIGVDADSDGFIGSVTNTQSCSSPGTGYALTAPAITDCNDDDAAVNAIATWYIGVDTDSDGFIGSVTDTQSCDSPGTGYALTAPAITDCNDDDAAVNAIATWYIGVDADSDGFIGSVTDTQSCDSPGTGYALTAPAITDCNDDDAAVNAIATWYIGVDADSDGFIGSVTDTQSCDSPGTGYALTAPAITDCNDDDAAVNAIATWYIGVDTDSDGFIGSVTDTQSCDSPGTGYALTAPAITDCNDDDAAVNAIATWYIGVDADSDGFIGSVTDTQSCDSPGTGYALTAPAITDCNDDDAAVNAIATWYIGVDADSDGFIGSVTNTQSCSSPGAGYALTPQTITDCNDDDASVNAIATWYIGVDADSDGFIGSVTDTQSCDSPGTGYALTAPAITDCNDDDADINPGATEVFDGVDNNCDGNVDEGFTNAAIWNGAINSDWTNVGNWDTNAPGLSPSDDVTIPSGLTNYPVLTSGQDLSLANGLSLTIASGASLSISPAVVITNNGTVIVDGSMTLQSDATGSAYIGSGSGTFTGDVTVERYISARRAYRQLSTPVTTSNFISNNWQQGTHITGSTAGANGFDATGSGNPSMYTFDNVAYNYVPMANTDATNLVTGQGYHMLVRGDRTTDLTNNNATPSETTLSATGTLVAENAGASIVNVTVPEQRFVFVGNPFQAPVDMNKVITTDATNINSTYYWVWDPTLGTRGAYAAVFAATGSTAVSDANQYLQAGQAGWVYTAAPGATQLSFTQASKNTSVSETAVFKTTAKKASTGELRLSLYETSALAANQSAVDGILVLFDDAGNNAVDGSDAPKFTNLDETFSTSNNGTLLAIESRATPVDTDEITLSITTYRDNNYTIVAEGTAVQGEAPYLFDAYADVYTEIPQNGTVNYAYSIDDNIPASMDAERFTVVFGQQALTVSNLDIERIMLYPNPSNTGQFYLNIPQQMDDLEVTIYNALGAKLFYKTGFTAGQNVSIKTSFTRDQGLYFVNLTSKGATTTKKLIIN